MNSPRRAKWEDAHRGKPPGDTEPFVIETLPMLARGGLVLDVAAGRGRNSIALAKAGIRVIAADYSGTAMRILADVAREQHLPIWPVIADFDKFAFRENTFDAIVNVNFLDRALFPHFARALKTGGLLIAETFLIDQAEIGHPKDANFLLKHHELRELMTGLELLRYREGLVSYPDGSRAWRASAVARRTN
jgi:tellurite methyltransferase